MIFRRIENFETKEIIDSDEIENREKAIEIPVYENTKEEYEKYLEARRKRIRQKFNEER